MALTTAALGLVLAAGSAGPAMATSNNGPLDKPQVLSNADKNKGGANGQCPGGAYCSTRDGSASMNGNGKGKATGKPAAGSKGKADNKNPKGQMPNGPDRNAGYECDRNNGIGKSNPAHTGCTSSVPPKVKPPKVYPPKVTPPKSTPPKVTPPKVTPPKSTPPKVTPPKSTPVVVKPAALVAQPTVLGAVAVAEAPAAVATHPLPTSAAAGQANTGGQLIAGASVAFAALLALGAGFLLRRRNGVA